MTGPSRYVAFALVLLIAAPANATEQQALRTLVLGGSAGSHRPAEMVRLFAAAIEPQTIAVEYTEEVDRALSAEMLDRHDVLMIYKDDGELSADNERRLLDFVRRGGGLVAVHCASHAFRNSDAYTQLVGGRFHHHDAGEFRPRIIDAQHPITLDWPSLQTWDETYVHNELAADNRVLLVRDEAGGYEPYAWVRRFERGRVFYTALGHDERTWSQPEFVDLLCRALRWTGGTTSGDEPEPVSIQEFSQTALTADPPPPLSPEESMQHMHLPEGFRVELFAAEPDIVKPLSMATDARGRWWVIESIDYPNDLLEPFAGNDRIKVCEDTTGDGRADKFTVFAEGLNIPTGLLPYRDGVIVALAPHIVLLRDTNGDGRADAREILYTGFNRDDTHAVCSNLRWGPDNWVWATVGYSGGVVRAGDKAHRFRQSVIRFRPDGLQFEVLTNTSNNTWGLGFNEAGNVFVSTANNQHSVHLAMPNRYFEQVRGWHAQGWSAIADHVHMHPVAPRIRQVDFFGGFTAACGQTIYTARAFPQEFWNRAALVCEPTGHLVHIDWLVPRGSDFIARDGWNLLASDDPWTAPIETHVGLDGAVWMIDWYNYIVRHNPTPPGFETGPGNAYITPQRDKHHGRIYRIVHADAPAAQPAFAQDTVDDLVAALRSDNMTVRSMAQRMLAERNDAAAVPALLDLVADAPEQPASMHALWLLADLQAAEHTPQRYAEMLARALKSPSVAVRRAAVDSYPRAFDSATVLTMLDDSDPGVRLQALLALSEMRPTAETGTRLAEFLSQSENADDRWLPLGLVAAAATADCDFLLAAIGQSPSEPLASAVRAVSEHWARGEHRQQLPQLLSALAQGEGPLVAQVVAGLHAGWAGDAKIEQRAELAQTLGELLEKLPMQAQLQLAALAERWDVAETVQREIDRIEEQLLQQAGDEALEPQQRAAAAQQLAALTANDDRLARLIDLISPRTPPTLADDLIAALAQSSNDRLGEQLVAAWPRLTPNARRQTVATLLSRPAWTSTLLQAVAGGSVAGDDLAIDQWQRLVRHPDRAIAERATELSKSSGRLPSADRQQVLDDLLPLAGRNGDAELGRQVFQQNCAKCHRYGEMGEAIGPDLTGIAARPREEILTDILDPNRSVEGNFRQYTVATTDGQIFTGLLLAETQTAVELLDSEAKRHLVLRDDIDQFEASPLSVMPEGFEKLSAAELTGLLEFLSAKGRFFPLPLDRAATIVSTLGMFYGRENEGERLIFDDWGPKQVDEVPFQLIDPRGDRVPNVILLHGPQGEVSRRMPRSVEVACNTAARQIHLLSGVSGWGFPLGTKGSLTLTVRLHYGDGSTEDHALLNGVHFADYIRQVDVPESQFAFKLRSQQMRYLSLTPQRPDEEIRTLEFIKGSDQTAPVVMAVTIERP